MTRHSDSVWDVTASGGILADLNGTVTLGFASGQDIADRAGNRLATDGTPSPNENSFEIENTAPRASKIERLTPSTSPTNADAVTWRVSFNEDVVNVSDGDFTVSGSGIGTVDVSVTRASASEWDVAASGGNLAGLEGTIVLGFDSEQDIEDLAGNRLSTAGTPNPNENSFAIENTAPTVSKIERQMPSTSPTAADEVTWRVTFSETVEAVDGDDFAVSGAGNVTVEVSEVSASVRDVSASGGGLADLNGTVTLGFARDTDIADPAGNGLSTSGTPNPNENAFALDNLAPNGLED